MNDVYAILHTKKVADRVKKKGSLNYISWADCWAMIKESFPDAASRNTCSSSMVGSSRT